MSLLPKKHSEFAEEEYWDMFFKKRGDKSFDWYGEYPQLSSVIDRYVKTSDRILMVGCGNSTLSENLYDLSYECITNIDISEPVINQMKAKHAKKRPNMSFTKMDATSMTFENESFRIAIDKGTLDAVLPDSDNTQIAVSMFSEVWRCLKVMGCYIIVTLAQDHVIKTLINHFNETGACVLRAHLLCTDTDDKFDLPVFALVMTKLKGDISTIWESNLTSSYCTDIKPVRHKNKEELLSSIKNCQYFSIFRQSINDARSDKKIDKKEKYVELLSSETQTPRYTIYIIDNQPTRSNGGSNLLAVFISPRGTHDDLYVTAEGRIKLAAQINYRRVLIVVLSADQSYTGLEEVKSELSHYVMQLSPHGAQEKTTPFLSSSEGVRC